VLTAMRDGRRNLDAGCERRTSRLYSSSHTCTRSAGTTRGVLRRREGRSQRNPVVTIAAILLWL
jgi:hypothetical protein